MTKLQACCDHELILLATSARFLFKLRLIACK